MKITSRLIIWILCAGALVLAWGPHAHHNESAASTTHKPPPTTPSKRPPGADPIATSANVSVDHGVSFSLHVTNVADHSLELDFPNGQTHDFVVLDSIGREVWRWSKGRMFTQALQNKLLGSTETVTYEESWDPTGHRGAFTALAILRSSNFPVKEKIAFRLP